MDVDRDRASARTYVHAILMVNPASQETWVDAVGSYDDQLVRTTQGWRIAVRVSRIARLLKSADLAATS